MSVEALVDILLDFGGKKIINFCDKEIKKGAQPRARDFLFVHKRRDYHSNEILCGLDKKGVITMIKEDFKDSKKFMIVKDLFSSCKAQHSKSED